MAGPNALLLLPLGVVAVGVSLEPREESSFSPEDHDTGCKGDIAVVAF